MAKVLLCDDDDNVLRTLSRVLTQAGHVCRSTASAGEALSELAADPAWDVVLTDWQMPGTDGTKLLAAVAERAPSIARILMSGTADYREACRAVNGAGAARLLAKPFDRELLTATIDELLELRRLRAERDDLARHLAVANLRLQSQNEALEQQVQVRTASALDGLISALDMRDTETQWHSRRVALFARRLAEELGVEGQALVDCEQGALLHDLGKIGVRDSILLKPAKLTEEEWVEMRRHPGLGWEILRPMPFLRGAAQIVWTHHERWDGGGYPRGLLGRAIPLGARIFAVVDTLDAMTSDRPYRAGRPYAIARDEISRFSGSQFDPTVVAAFLRVPEGDWAHIRSHVEELAHAHALGDLELSPAAAA